MNSIFIPYNVPSSKNSKIATSKGVFHSKVVGKYLSNLGIQHYSCSKKIVKEYKTKPNIFRSVFNKSELKFKDPSPIKLGMYFIRDSKRKFDYINVSQIILDLMTAHDIIEDDNMDCVIPIFKGYCIDKENPGIVLTIEE